MAIPFQDQPTSTTDLLRPEEKCNTTSSVPMITEKNRYRHRRLFQVLIYVCLFVGSIGSSLLSRFYFRHGGSNRWLATLVQSVGFPLLLLLICLSPSSSTARPFANFSGRQFLLSLFLGLMLGINNLLFSCGASYLPVSTSSLLLSTQLAFTLVFTAVLVRTPLTFTNVNTVVCLTISSLLLAFQKSSGGGDVLPGESQAQYYLGFLATLGAAVMFALYLPVMEIVYRGVTCFRMVMEVQIVMEAVATALAATGMTMASHGWQESWDLGPGTYWLVLGATVLTWQLCFVGTAGMIFVTTSLHSGICMTALLPINVMAGVALLGDELGPVKCIAMALCVWGFASYVYGEYKKMNENVVGSTEGDVESNVVTVVVVERKYGSVNGVVGDV